METTMPADLKHGQQATEQYEALRAMALGQPGAMRLRRELTLVLQRGLAAWLHVWRQCAEATSTTIPAPTAGVPTPPAATSLPLQAQLAAILATMALAHAPRRSGV